MWTVWSGRGGGSDKLVTEGPAEQKQKTGTQNGEKEPEGRNSRTSGAWHLAAPTDVKEHYIVIMMVAEGLKELISWSKYKKWSLLHLTGWWLADMSSLIYKEDGKKNEDKMAKMGQPSGAGPFSRCSFSKASWQKILRNKYYAEVTTRGSLRSHPRTTENCRVLKSFKGC